MAATLNSGASFGGGQSLFGSTAQVGPTGGVRLGAVLEQSELSLVGTLRLACSFPPPHE